MQAGREKLALSRFYTHEHEHETLSFLRPLRAIIILIFLSG